MKNSDVEKPLEALVVLLILVKLVSNRTKNPQTDAGLFCSCGGTLPCFLLSYYWVKGEQFKDRIHKMAAQNDTIQFDNRIYQMKMAAQNDT